MPTATGRETTAEREARQRRERFAAMREAITPDMRREAEADAATVAAQPDDYRAAAEIKYPAGEKLSLRAGRRTLDVDEGELRRLAFADALEASGRSILGYTMQFGIAAGRGSIFYGVRLG